MTSTPGTRQPPRTGSAATRDTTRIARESMDRVSAQSLLGLVFGVAYAQATRPPPGTDQVRTEILTKVRRRRGSGRATSPGPGTS